MEYIVIPEFSMPNAFAEKSIELPYNWIVPLELWINVNRKNTDAGGVVWFRYSA